MGKILNTYRGYTASELKTRSSIPAQADIAVNASDIDCSNISLNEVKVLIGDAAANISLVCKSSNINEYSHFQPGWWQLDTGVLDHKLPSVGPYKLGDFAGYNNNAISPFKDNFNTGVSSPSGGTVTVYATVNVAEVDWTQALIAGINGVGFQVKQGSSIKATASPISYTDTTHQNGFDFSESFNIGTIFTDLTVRVYFTKDGVEVCPVPGISDYTVDVTLLIPTFIRNVDMDTALQSVYPTGTLIYDSASLNTTTDKYSISGLAISTTTPNDEGDVNRFNMDLWARKNEGAWSQVVDNFFLQTTGYTITDDDLPWSINVYGDFVDFELRDGI